MHTVEAIYARIPQAQRNKLGLYHGHIAAVLAAIAECDAVAPSTPAAHWREAGEPDPHEGHYDKQRAQLALGQLTDDELANEAFLRYDVRPSIEQLLNGTAYSPIVYMTAVKERIRWLSRALEKKGATP